MTCVLPKDNVQVLILSTSECELFILLFRNRVATGVTKMRSYWSRMGPQSNMTGVLVIRGERHKGRRWPCDDRGRGWTADGSTSQNAKAYRQLPEARKGKEGFSHTDFRRSIALLTP